MSEKTELEIQLAEVIKTEVDAKGDALKAEIATILEKQNGQPAPSPINKGAKEFFEKGAKALEQIAKNGAKMLEVPVSYEVLRAITSASFTPASDWGTTVTLPGIERPLADKTRFNLLDYIQVQTTTATHLKKARRGARSGNVAFINECELKPLINQA